jgi:predicted phage terminase large subunit-like protein
VQTIPLNRIDAALGRKRFDHFVDIIDPKLARAQFHNALDAAIQDWVVNGGFLIIVAPPRHGKSQRVSRLLPAHLLAIDPSLEIIGASYNLELAKTMSQDVRRYVNSPRFRGYYPETKIARGENRADQWRTTEGGGYRAAGIDTGVTGMGANRLIIDDPVKNREQAESPAYRRRVWNEYTSTFRTRLQPDNRGKIGVLLTLTRWHTDDLAGRLLELSEKDSDADAWHALRFPAIRDDKEHDRHHLDTREIGEALWPERFPVDALKAIRAASERDWQALFQGLPVADVGDLFKAYWFKLWFEGKEAYAPPLEIVVGPEGEDFSLPQIPYPAREIVGCAISVDATFKKTPGADYVSMGVWKRTKDNRHFRVDQVHKKMDYTETKAELKRLIEEYNPGKVLIEDAANGPAVISELRQDYGDKIEPRSAAGGKVARANATAPFFEQGRIYVPHPQQCGWTRGYFSELTTFPGSAHDDMVDDTTHYLEWIMEQGGATSWLRTIVEGR